MNAVFHCAVTVCVDACESVTGRLSVFVPLSLSVTAATPGLIVGSGATTTGSHVSVNAPGAE